MKAMLIKDKIPMAILGRCGLRDKVRFERY